MEEKFEPMADGYVYVTIREYIERYEDLWFVNCDGEMEMYPVKFEEE